MVEHLSNGLTGEALIKALNDTIDSINREIKSISIEDISSEPTLYKMVIPSGGGKGQVLTKKSNKDYDVYWK